MDNAPQDERQHVAEMQQRLEQVEEDIQEARQKGLGDPHERHWVDSGDEPGEDDQTIAPPG